MKSKVNLIPFNDWEGSSYRRPPLPRILAFQAILLDAGITTTVRWSKGEDIGAACGQLEGAGGRMSPGAHRRVRHAGLPPEPGRLQAAAGRASRSAASGRFRSGRGRTWWW